MHSDFDRLYHALGMDPDCDLTAFRHAYRRRLSLLHPDKAAGDTPAGDLSLHELRTLYRNAITFHREHGRLPGGMPAAMHWNSAGALNPSLPIRLNEANQRQRRGGKGRWELMILVVALAALPLVPWAVRQSEAVPEPVRSNQADAAGNPSRAASPSKIAPEAPIPAAPEPRPALRNGMKSDEVLALVGKPGEVRGDYWWYGPSWISFADDRVDRWYSSPLHPLRAIRQPAPTATDPGSRPGSG